MEPIRDNIVRAIFPGAELRAEGDVPRLTGHFARFNEWNMIDSALEGRFLERIDPGAFTKTLSSRTPKVLFNHGKDPEIGDKVIATRSSFPIDDIGPGIDAEVLDGLPPLVMSGLRAGEYGMSYRFSIPSGGDVWDRTAKRSDYNPGGVPERTIREAIVFEAGPVTWPADGGTDASVRSLTDLYTTQPPVAPVQPRKEPRVEANELTPIEKASRLSELKDAIKRQADETTGVRSVEAQARWEADLAEHDKLTADLAVIETTRARLQSLGESPKHVVEPFNVIRTRGVDDIYNPDQLTGIGFASIEQRNQQLRDNALRSLESAHLDKKANPDELSHLLDRDQDEMNEKGLPELASRMLITGSPVYKRAFAKYLRTGNSMAFTPEEQRAAALAVVGTTTTGGYAVPYVFDPTIIRIGAYTAQNPYRQACRTVTITSGNNWRGVTVGAVTSAYAAEAAANIEGGPTFAQPTYTVQRAQAFATVSIETLEDRPDISGELTGVFADSKSTLEENKFTLGAGTTVFPQGMFLSGAYTTKATATNDVTAILDTTAVEGDLPLRFRANGEWFMNRSTLRQLQILDTSYRYFSGAGIQFPGNSQPNQLGSNGGGNTGLQLLGYPIWEVPSAVSTLTTDAAVIAVFCDPSTYIIVDRVGMNVEVIANMLNGATPSFPTGERGIFAYWRNTARCLLADGGRQLVVQ